VADADLIARRIAWVREGTELALEQVDALSDESLSGPSGLPDWTRAHVVAHIGLNANGLANLLHWARTGEETPMYVSMEARNADIETWSALPPAELRARVAEASSRFADSLDDVTDWGAQVRNFQGAHIPASTIPWYRARELMIHTVDLDAGTTMGDLPTGFLIALVDEVSAQRSASIPGPALTLRHGASERHWHVEGEGEPADITGSVADIAAYLLGRPAPGLRTADGSALPDLPRWL